MLFYPIMRPVGFPTETYLGLLTSIADGLSNIFGKFTPMSASVLQLPKRQFTFTRKNAKILIFFDGTLTETLRHLHGFDFLKLF
jgi:hypothetical protein